MIFWQAPSDEPIAARVAIAGDFLPAGNLALPAGGWSEAATGLAPYFADCVTFCNLESTLDAEDLPSRPIVGLGQTVSARSASLDFLRAIGCDVVGLANNHSMDFGLAGADRTRAAVARAGMVPLGAGRRLRDTPEVFVWQGPAGIRVGFWAAAIASRDLSTRTSAGVEPATVARSKDAIHELKSRGAGVSIALLHAGCLRTNRPDPTDAARMNEIASCGFNIVASSHSHRSSGARILQGHPPKQPVFLLLRPWQHHLRILPIPYRTRRTHRRCRFHRSWSLRANRSTPGPAHRIRIRRSSLA